MDMVSLALVMGSTVAGGIVASVCGFGFGAVAMACWPYLIGYTQSVAVSALCGISTAVIIVVSNRKHVNLKILLPCALTGLVASATCVILAAKISDKTMIHALGAMLLAVSIYSMFFGGKIRIKGTPLNGIIAGFLGGAGAGLFSVGGPPVAIYMLSSTKDNQEYRATLNAHFCFTSGIATLTRFYKGIITVNTLQIWLLVLAAVACGIFLGNKIFKRLDAKKLRMAVYGYMAISAITMLIK